MGYDAAVVAYGVRHLTSSWRRRPATTMMTPPTGCFVALNDASGVGTNAVVPALTDDDNASAVVAAVAWHRRSVVAVAAALKRHSMYWMQLARRLRSQQLLRLRQRTMYPEPC